jgi:type 1 glutamine amidotransferase
MLFLHHALCSFQEWDGFIEMVGGQYVIEENRDRGLPLSAYAHDLDIPVQVVNRDHPVTEGIADFVIHDEGYTHLQMAQGITPLLTTDHPGCASPLGWVNECEGSTIVYLMLGHDRQAYDHPSYRQLILQSLQWLTGFGNGS